MCGIESFEKTLNPKKGTSNSHNDVWLEERLCMALLLSFVFSIWESCRFIFQKGLVAEKTGKSLLNLNLEN